MKQDPQTIRMAIVGYQQKIQECHAAIAELKQQLGGDAVPSKPHLSAEARARIAAAQRRRWADTKKKLAQAERANRGE